MKSVNLKNSVHGDTMGAPNDLVDDSPSFDDRLTFVNSLMIWSDSGISVVSRFDGEKWHYHIVKDGAPVTRMIASAKAPYEEDPRVRDSGLKKTLLRIKGDVNVDEVMGALEEFGVYLMSAPEATDFYMDSIAEHIAAPEALDEALVTTATEILETGDPVQFIMDTFHSIHVGDDDYGRLLMLAIASQHVRNTHGIHLTPSGASGKGKSHAGRTMLHLVPHKFWLSASLSPKSLYYYDVPIGTIIFSDDVIIEEELISIIRRCITGFVEKQEHITVSKDREGTKMLLSERIIWIIASVENFMDEQTRNRMIDVPVDEGEEVDEEVYKKQVIDAVSGADEFPITDDVLVCRELFRIIKSIEPTTVTIPYAPRIVWKNKNNRRNFDTFKEIIKAFTLLRHEQRSVNETDALIATVADYNDAKNIYLNKAEGEHTKMTKRELKIVRMLADHGNMTIKMLQGALGESEMSIYRALKGRDGKSGLLDKVPALTCESRTDKDGENSSVRRDWFDVTSNFNRMDIYSDVVSLDMESDDIDPGAEGSCGISMMTMLDDVRAWWRSYTKHDEYDATEFLQYILSVDPKYNTVRRQETLLWILENKKDGREGWCR